MRVKIPPAVSMPSDNGVTSNNRTSFTSPWKIPPCTAAPSATTSSGFTLWFGSLPKKSFTISLTFGMRVIPPTNTTSSISPGDKSASFNAFLIGSMVREIRSSTSASSFARLSLIAKCFGPVASAVMYGRLISVSMLLDSSIFAFSAASFKRCSAKVSLRRSTLLSFLNSSARYSITRLSKSSPPKNVSPLVALTSIKPSPISKTDTSKVPPPRS